MGDDVDVQGRITDFWNLRGTTYDGEPGLELATTEERAAWLAALSGLLPPPPADVLDVGTGTGFFALLLAELGHRTLGIDLAEGMLAVARAKAARLRQPPAFAIGDAIAPPLPPGSFDVVASRHVLWTLTDLPRAFANWRSLLRPGGRVVAIDALWWSESPPAPTGDVAGDTWQAIFAEHYSDPIRAALPLMSSPTIAPVLNVVLDAGFVNVRVSSLAELECVVRVAHPERVAPERYALTASRAD